MFCYFVCHSFVHHVFTVTSNINYSVIFLKLEHLLISFLRTRKLEAMPDLHVLSDPVAYLQVSQKRDFNNNNKTFFTKRGGLIRYTKNLKCGMVVNGSKKHFCRYA